MQYALFLMSAEICLLCAWALTQIISTADLNRSSPQLIQTDNLEYNLNSLAHQMISTDDIHS